MSLQRHEKNSDFVWHDIEGPFRIITGSQADRWNQDGGFLLEQVIPQSTLDELITDIDPMEVKTNEFLHGER